MQRLVLGLVGELASGKGTVAQYIAKNYKGSVHGFSTSLRDIAKRMHLEENRENLQKISTMFRENFHDDILSEVVYYDVKKDDSEIIVVDGVRRMADINFMKKLPDFKLVYIEADIKLRYERIVSRDQNTDDASKTFDEFVKDHEREAELQVRELKKYATFVIDNEGSFEELYKQIDKIIQT